MIEQLTSKAATWNPADPTLEEPPDKKEADTVERAIEQITNGGMVVVIDDADRENEGDLIMAAELATPEALAFMIRHTSGVICVAMPGNRLDELRLPLMVSSNTEAQGTAFTVSVDLRKNVSTGISAADRAATIRALAEPATSSEDLSRPGHVFPLRYHEGGVLERAGHTEAALDLARMAGRSTGGILCEIVNDDGTMARRLQLERFAAEHGLPVLTVDELVHFRHQSETLVSCFSQARTPTKFGEFIAYVYRSVLDNTEHVALTMGEVAGHDPVLARVHSECLTGDVFGSLRCDCGTQLELALEKIAADGRGVLVYLRGHEGRGIGLGHKLRAYGLQDAGMDTVEANLELGFAADSREYGIGAQILADLGVSRMRLMTNNPAKYHGISGHGLKIVERVDLAAQCTAENERYLATKRDKLGHLLVSDTKE